MSITIIQERLKQYRCQNPLEEALAIKEITQEIILMALSRSNFFTQAEFHGGTALRILYGLPRFSEDLDFALLSPDPTFQLSPYLENLAEELTTFGYQLEVRDRSKVDNILKKAFIKDEAIGKLLLLAYATPKLHQKIIIKLELDSNPPLGAQTESKLLNFPFPFEISAKDLPSSFSGKLHALLCRPYTKGRDWYDFLWYTRNRITVNFNLLRNALQQTGPWEGENIVLDTPWLILTLKDKIKNIVWADAVKDIEKFILPIEQPSLNLWSADLFLSCLAQLEKYLSTSTLGGV